MTALSPGSSSDPHCTSESRWYQPHREQEEAGPRVQEHGHVPCLGRTVRGGASVCFQPLSCIQVELIGREDTRCPVPGGSEASTWCFCSTAVLGPGQCTCLPGAQVMRLSVATCCLSHVGRDGQGSVPHACAHHPGPESLPAGPLVWFLVSLQALALGGFKLLLPCLKGTLQFTEPPSHQLHTTSCWLVPGA